MPARTKARYFIETASPLEQAAETMAGEQSTGTFLRVPGETDELREAHAATIGDIQEVEPAAAPSLPGAVRANASSLYHRAIASLSWPLSNMGPSLPNVMATVAGNLF